MAAGPVAIGHGADVERHLDAFAHVVAGAAHLHQVPARAEVAGAPVGIGFKPARGEHDRLGLHVEDLALMLDLHAVDFLVVIQQSDRAVLEFDGDAEIADDLRFHFPDAGTAAPEFQREPAPELHLAVDLEGLAAVHRHEPDALGVHPLGGLETFGHQDFAEFRIGPVLGDAEHVVEELIGRVGAEIVVLFFIVGQVDEGHDVLQAVMRETQRARRISAVAAGFVLVGAFQDADLRAILVGRHGGTHRGVAGAHDDYVKFFTHFSRFPQHSHDGFSFQTRAPYRPQDRYGRLYIFVYNLVQTRSTRLERPVIHRISAV